MPSSTSDGTSTRVYGFDPASPANPTVVVLPGEADGVVVVSADGTVYQRTLAGDGTTHAYAIDPSGTAFAGPFDQVGSSEIGSGDGTTYAHHYDQRRQHGHDDGDGAGRSVVDRCVN